MGLIDRGQAALAARLKTAAGRTVTYARKAGGTVELTAWVGRTAFRRTTDQPGAAVVWGERDYLFAAADLSVGGTAHTPAEGDRVTETIDGADVTFEVRALPGEPVWRYSDPTRRVIRVHCKRVST